MKTTMKSKAAAVKSAKKVALKTKRAKPAVKRVAAAARRAPIVMKTPTAKKSAAKKLGAKTK